MKVIHVVIRLDGGGAERTVSRLIAPLAAHGVTALRVALAPAWEGEESAPADTLLERKEKGIIAVLLAASRLRRRLKIEAADVLHLHCERPELVGLLAVSFMRTAPSIVVTRHSRREWSRLPLIGRVVRTALVRKGARFIACFEETGSRDTFIPNPTTAELSPPDDSSSLQRLIYVGRLNPGKRVDWIIEALHESWVGVQLLVVGDGPSRSELERLSERQDVPVRFAGFALDPWSLRSRGDAYISASEYEGEPLALIEAIAAGMPILLSDIPAHRAVLPAHPGYFATRADLSDCLSKLAAGRLQPSALIPSNKLRGETIELRRPERVAARWAQVYTNSTSAPSNG